jgi:hypothetical protein
MKHYLDDKTMPIIYLPKFREYGIQILDGGSSFQEISHCPWCGCQLPLSLRDDWFNELEDLGFDEDSSDIPSKYFSDEWWNTSVNKNGSLVTSIVLKNSNSGAKVS